MNQGFPRVRTVGTWLTTEEFFAQFERSWLSLTTRYRKLECLQRYAEPGDPSYDAFLRGNLTDADRLVRERIRSQAPLFEEAKAKGVQILRLRVIVEPPSAYLKYEIPAYEEAEKLGEEILLVPASTEEAAQLSDFLLFDDRLAIVHNYDDEAALTGAWLVEDLSTVRELGLIADRLTAIGFPLQSYLRREQEPSD